jgi:hypothetical protein
MICTFLITDSYFFPQTALTGVLQRCRCTLLYVKWVVIFSVHWREVQTSTVLNVAGSVVTMCTASGHYMYRQWSLYVPPMVTRCTASGHYMNRQWSLYVPPVVTIWTASGHYMYRQWSLHEPPVVTICTASDHYMNRQWSLYVPPVVTIWTASGHYMNRQFNIHKLHVLPTECIYVFCVDLRTNSDYFTIQH